MQRLTTSALCLLAFFFLTSLIRFPKTGKRGIIYTILPSGWCGLPLSWQSGIPSVSSEVIRNFQCFSLGNRVKENNKAKININSKVLTVLVEALFIPAGRLRGRSNLLLCQWVTDPQTQPRFSTGFEVVKTWISVKILSSCSHSQLDEWPGRGTESLWIFISSLFKWQ